MSNVLVTDGAGYIGAHAVRQLVERGHSVVVVDNLDRGHADAVPSEAAFVEGDVRDEALLVRVMREHSVEIVMHFAALAYVAESVYEPFRYYANNVGGMIGLLAAMRETGVGRLVFSSTCTTYGEPEEQPIRETTPQAPIHPYGCSKWMAERILRDEVAARPEFGFTALRYFNVAGCAADGSLGERHEPETHLIPLVILAALGKRDAITVFGRDFPTPDGTCVRDYVHVEDLCRAHLLAMDRVEPGAGRFYNLGIGRGYSVAEVVESVRRVTGREFPVVDGPRRAGDAPILTANADLARAELGWEPRYTELDDIVRTAWDWFSKNAV